jgi:hypothetical protein
MSFSLFDDFHLSVVFLFTIVAFPLNQALGINIDETYIYYGLLAANMFVYFWYIVIVIGQITSYLDIYCLSIKQKKVKPQ